MNKTVTINISGIIFHIEEDAYEKLSKYLITIKGYFSKTDGGNEIMGDIEARVAELLQEKINAGKQVVLMTDVDYVMQVMGKPEDFGEGQTADQTETKAEEAPYTIHEEKIKRRLFRNPDEKAIGGVCSGLAAYFDVDTVWVRLAMFFLVFFGGLSLWVYIIMWMIIPEAKTTADRFAMRGESANINNIMRNFKEEAEEVKNRFSKAGKEFKNSEYTQTIKNNTADVITNIFNIIGRFLGFGIFIIGVLLLFGYILAIMGVSIIGTESGVHSNTDLSNWKSMFLESPGDYVIGLIAFIIVVGIPVFMLIYAGIKLMFRIRYSNRWLNVSLGLIWTIGFVMGIYILFTTLRHFSETSRVKETTELHAMGDTIVIRLNPALNNLKLLNPDNETNIEHYLARNHKRNGFCFPEFDHKMGVIGFAKLNVSESSGDSTELIITKSSKGAFKKEANENAREIRYSYKQNKNELVFDEIFFVTPGVKFRDPEVDIRLRLPIGKVVRFDNSLKYMLDDVENTTNTWDGDMVGRRWIMTEKGLKCIDCNNLESEDDSEENKEDKVVINDEGIKVRNKETQIDINADGIKIKTPEENVNIKNDTKQKDKKED